MALLNLEVVIKYFNYLTNNFYFFGSDSAALRTVARQEGDYYIGYFNLKNVLGIFFS